MNELLNPAVIDQLRAEIFGNIANIKSVVEREKPPIKYSLTDLGNTERFLQLFPDEIVYIPEENDFFYYNNKKWTRDLQGKYTHELVDKTVRSIYGEAKNIPNETTRKEIAKWAIKSEEKKRRDAIFNDLKPRLAKSITEFDHDPWLFNVQNGTIDLRTGKLRPHDRADYLMKISPVTYDSEAKCPLWLSTLDLFFQKSNTVIDYLQRLFGYTIPGIVKSLRIFPFIWGKKRNGKTTILNTILKIFGDYGHAVDISTFTENRWQRQAGAATPDISRLKDTRMVLSTEIGENDKLNEKFMNGISGGDTLTARNLHANFYDFQATFTVWLFGNKKIKVSEDSKETGTGDRLKYIPMTYQIPEDQADPSIGERLFNEESSGILNWLIEGCLKFQSEGLKEPAEIKNATSEFFAEQNPVEQFLDQCCNIAEMDSVKYSLLYAAFCGFSDVQLSRQKFSKILKDKGIEVEALTGNKKYAIGVSLKKSGEFEFEVEYETSRN